MKEFGFLTSFILHKYLCTISTWSSVSETSQQLSGQSVTPNTHTGEEEEEKTPSKKFNCVKKKEGREAMTREGGMMEG